MTQNTALATETIGAFLVQMSVSNCVLYDTLVSTMKRTASIEKVALYARVSTKDGRQDAENQLLALREYCQKAGWEIAGE